MAMAEDPCRQHTQENLVILESLVFAGVLTHEKLAAMTTAEVIASRRKALKLSYAKLAALVSEREGGQTAISWQTVQQWEKGTSAPKRKRLEHVAAVLGLSVEELLPSENGTMRPSIATSDWPFPQIDRARFEALELWQRTEIQGVVRERIKEFEAENAANAKAA
jgi:transcriptional regulator with XRE-family HTH domain